MPKTPAASDKTALGRHGAKAAVFSVSATAVWGKKPGMSDVVGAEGIA